MEEIISVSLGSSRGNYEIQFDIEGIPFRLRRFGTDGSWQTAASLLQHYDGRAAAIGLGGINRRYILGNRRYRIPQGERLARVVRYSPLADGEMWKQYVEPLRIEQLAQIHPLEGKQAVLVSWLDRYSLIEALERRGCHVLSGDAFYALGWPWWQRPATFRLLARLMMPVLAGYPLENLYPMGRRQDEEPARARQGVFRRIGLLVGDTHLMMRRLPEHLGGIGIIASTLRRQQRQILLQRGAAWVETINPVRLGRGLAANAWEAMALAAAVQRPQNRAQWLAAAKKIGWFDGSK